MTAEGGTDGARSAAGSRDGTSQIERFPEALAEDYFLVDERPLEELISLSARLAGNVHVDPDRPGVGTWVNMFRMDPAGVLADVASLRLKGLESSLSRLIRQGDPVRAARQVGDIAWVIEAWHRVLASSDDRGAEAMGQRIAELITTSLAGELRDVVAYLVRSAPSHATGFGRFGPRWGIELSDDGRPLVAEGAGKDGDPLERIARAGGRFIQGLSYLQEGSTDLLASSLRSGRHDPAIGLHLAFLVLFQRAQRKLNEFSRRRLEFYYRDVLRVRLADWRPDQAHVVLTPAPGVTSLLIPGGTEFSAGRDERKNDLVFVSDEDLVLTDAKVASIRSLYFERSPYASPEREFGFVSGVSANAVEGPLSTAAEGDETLLFGAEKTGGVAGVGGPASLGFAVASPLLDLREGQREVRFDVRMAPARLQADALEALWKLEPTPGDGGDAGAERFFRLFGRIMTGELLSSGEGWLKTPPPEGPDEPLKGDRRAVYEKAQLMLRDTTWWSRSIEVVERILRRDREGLFAELFKDAFSMRFTAENGWHEVKDHSAEMEKGGEGLGFVLRMELGPEMPAIAGYSESLHARGFDTTLPVVAFRVNPDALFHPYSLLEHLELGAVNLEVRAEGVTDLYAFNQIGQIDPTKPFHPFGPLPTADSYFVFGNYAAARMPLQEARLSIEWSDVPTGEGGWREHYSGYDTEFEEDSFKVEVSVLRDRRWQPAAKGHAKRTSLFGAVPGSFKVEKERTLELEVLSYSRPLGRHVTEEQFRTSGSARDGLFRLSLSPSPAAFGHAEHARVLTRTLTANARKKRPDPEPNPPYTPIVKRAELSYVARSTISLGTAEDAESSIGEAIFHEHPFGVQNLSRASADSRFSLLPRGPEALLDEAAHGHCGGFLFLGLTASLVPEELSLLVDTVEHVTRSSADDAAHTHWFCLASNRWQRLTEDRVLGDTSHSFRTSGIVTLRLPPDLDATNSVLPNGLFWLAVGFSEEMVSVVERLISIHAGALTVTWSDKNNLRSNLSTSLPAGTIRGTARPIAGLGSVTQLGPSSGGRPPEDTRRLVTRTSERLRHRGRASSWWDYERLVLESFPDLFKVKCFPHTSFDAYPEPAPGQALVVVVPRLTAPSPTQPRMSLVNPAELDAIRDLLRERASGAARIEVRNAMYEEVQVRCRVRFARGSVSGSRIRELNQALTDFIAPWRRDGRGARFGWRIRHRDVAALLHEFSFVDYVTDVSLLHVDEDKTVLRMPDRHRLDDSALGAEEVCGRYPWSLAVPSLGHHIAPIPDDAHHPDGPQPTGLGELQIGRNFIIGRHR